MTEKNIILHIGHPKTGSSALQSFFALNHDRLAAHKICYPLPKNYQHAAAGGISSGNGREWAANLKELSLNCGETALFSSEHLFSILLNEDHRKKLCARSKAKDFKLKIVVYTRDFFEFSFSGWGQYIKRANGSLGYVDFMLADEPMPHFLNGENFNLLRRWIDIANQEGICLEIYNYERHRKNIFEHFVQNALELNYDEMGYQRPRNKIINRSLTQAEYELQRQFNILNLERSSSFISDTLVENLPNIASENPQLSEYDYHRILEMHEGVITDINSHLPEREAIRITPYENLEQGLGTENKCGFMFSAEQLAILARSISSRLKESESSAIQPAKTTSVQPATTTSVQPAKSTSIQPAKTTSVQPAKSTSPSIFTKASANVMALLRSAFKLSR